MFFTAFLQIMLILGAVGGATYVVNGREPKIAGEDGTALIQGLCVQTLNLISNEEWEGEEANTGMFDCFDTRFWFYFFFF